MRVFAFVCQLQRQKECVSPDCGRSCCSEWYLHRLENQRLINLPMIHGRWGVPVFSSLHGLINVNGLIISAETDIRQDIMKNTSCYKVTCLLFFHHDLGWFKTNNIKNWSLEEGLEQSETLIESTGRSKNQAPLEFDGGEERQTQLYVYELKLITLNNSIRLSSGCESELLVELHQPITDATSRPGEARLFCETSDGIKAWVGKRAEQISHGYNWYSLLVVEPFTCSGFVLSKLKTVSKPGELPRCL